MREHGTYIECYALGIEEGPVLFQMTTKLIVQALHKGKACNGKACKDKSFKDNACKGMACKGDVS
jgi:hypothetical protein